MQRYTTLTAALILSVTLGGCASAARQPIAPTLPPLAGTAIIETATQAPPTNTATPSQTALPTITSTPTNPLSIELMRQQQYPGSQLVFEQILDPGANYDRFIVSYMSEGNKIYALLTIPRGERPASGWPVIIFNHGFIPPRTYQTTERYVAYVDTFARHGYIVLKSDYRGHGDSEGAATGGYGTPGYTVDVLNGLASIKQYPDADPNRIGMWGHSMGGYITLRSMVVSKDIKAGVIWGGVVASYPDMFTYWWNARPGPTPTPNPDFGRTRWRADFLDRYGTPEENPAFWASISANSYLADISGPLQLHHSVEDEEVPVKLSEILYDELQAAGKPVELYEYEGDNHNIAVNFSMAMLRSVEFFDQWVKGGG